MSDSPESSGGQSDWHWHPPLPIENAPYLAWPPRPWVVVKFVLGRGFLVSQNSLYVVLAFLVWLYLAPPMEQWVSFRPGWLLHLLALNLALIVITASALHLYLHVYKVQGLDRKFDARETRRTDRKFFAGSQLFDNMFYTCASGVPMWTAFQAIVMWAYANGFAPWLEWSEHPVWFVSLFLLLPFWGSLHFYLIHRLLHWRPLYRVAHAVHHRNVAPIPWSGLSMHPIEHVLYLSFVFIHLVIPSHPVHMFFLGYSKLLSAITSHSGYEDILCKGERTIEVGEFFHQLHHRYLDCNYGTTVMPWDKWLGSFHDGTAQATARVRELQLKRRTTRAIS